MQYYITLCYCCKNHRYIAIICRLKIELQSSTCNMIMCIMCIVPMNIIRCVIIIVKHGKYMKHNTLRNIIFFSIKNFVLYTLLFCILLGFTSYDMNYDILDCTHLRCSILRVSYITSTLIYITLCIITILKYKKKRKR